MTNWIDLMMAMPRYLWRRRTNLVLVPIIIFFFLSSLHWFSNIPTFLQSLFVVTRPMLLAEDRASAGQQLVNYISTNLRVIYQSQSSQNIRHVTLINEGELPIPASNWTIYFSDVQSSYVKGGPVFFANNKLKLNHYDGWFLYLEPELPHPLSLNNKTQFILLPPHGGNISFELSGNLKSKSYTFPRWYVAGSTPDIEPRVIKSTDDEEMGFLTELRPRSPEERYRDNNGVDESGTGQQFSTRFKTVHGARQLSLKSAENLIIPTPLRLESVTSEVLQVDHSWRIVFQKELVEEAKYLADVLKLEMTESIDTQDDKYKTKVIVLTRANITQPLADFNNNDTVEMNEAYVLRTLLIGQILITGHASSGVGSGVFYGIQSLLSLLEGSEDGRTVPIVEVVDAPRMPYRGLLLDVARGFILKQDIVKTLEIMAMYKLNRLHFHLSDDQGWRLEILGLGELTEVGGTRGHVGFLKEDMLAPYFGTIPRVQPQYYTVEDYKDILRHAKRCHVEVIPEIDMPGHIHAGIMSMRTRYTRLKKANAPNPDQFLISDPDDRSRYFGVNEQKDSMLNPCMNSTYAFVEHVVHEIVEMHKDITPLKTIHIGGDEVPGGALVNSPICQKFVASSQIKLEAHALKVHFVGRVVSMLAAMGVGVQAWEEGLGGDGHNPPPNITKWNHNSLTLNAWNSGKHLPITFANAGYKIVLSDSAQLYLDHPHEADVNEPGLYWATRAISIQKMFNYMPARNSLAHNGSFIHQQICNVNGMRDCPDLLHPENVIGMQGSLWGEMVRTHFQVEYMLYPRLLALAERAWHSADWERVDNRKDFNRLRAQDWDRFAAAIGSKELYRLEQRGIVYRIPPPGAKVGPKAIFVNTDFPDLQVQYSIDNGVTWYDVISSMIRRTADMKTVQLRAFKDSEEQRYIKEDSKELLSKICPVRTFWLPPASQASSTSNKSADLRSMIYSFLVNNNIACVS